MNLGVIFLTGLTTGALTCLAVQGGLLTSVIAGQKGKSDGDTGDSRDLKSRLLEKRDFLSVGMFLIAKLITHTLLGFLLGMLGSAVTLSLGVQVGFQVLAALIMIAAAMNLLDVHPIFRYMVLQPPKFMQHWVRSSSKGTSVFAPGLLGALTIFVPCGVTQAMAILAINSASPIQGALIMGIFVLGTWPLFATIGIATAKLSDLFRKPFLRVTAILLIVMGLWAINGALVVLDSPITAQKFVSRFEKDEASLPGQAAVAGPVLGVDGIQRVHIQIVDDGYSPNRFVVEAGLPVEMTVESKDVYTCAAAFTFRAFDIFELLEPTDKKVFTFTPTKPGNYTFACSMGMYTGVMKVI